MRLSRPTTPNRRRSRRCRHPLQAPAAQTGDNAPKRSGGIFSRMTSTAASWAQKTGQDLRSATPAAMMNRVSTGEPAPQRPAHSRRRSRRSRD